MTQAVEPQADRITGYVVSAFDWNTYVLQNLRASFQVKATEEGQLAYSSGEREIELLDQPPAGTETYLLASLANRLPSWLQLSALTGLAASAITSGVFDLARIPSITSAKIVSLAASKLTGTINLARIPTIPASKLAAGAGSVRVSRIRRITFTANTTWSTVWASQPDDAYIFAIGNDHGVGIAGDIMLGIGAPGSETEIADIAAGLVSTIANGGPLAIPNLKIAAGTRLSSIATQFSGTGWELFYYLESDLTT